MENFELNRKPKDSGTLDMMVSPICRKDGHKVAYVSFSDGKRTAEGEIPACRINKNSGFDEAEVAQLELYMKAELPNLKKMASSVNIMDAFMGKDV